MPHKPKAPKRREFFVTLVMRVELDQRLIDDVTSKDWRKSFYDLAFATDVAEHIAANAARGNAFDSLDGFADQPADRCEIIEVYADSSEENYDNA